MNEFLAQNMNELVTVVTQLLKSGTQLASEQMPELLKQIIQYKMIDIRVSSILTIIIASIALISMIVLAFTTCDMEEFFILSIIPFLVLIACIIIMTIFYVEYEQCIQTPMVVILKTIKFI